MLVVSDSSPFIGLLKIGHIDVLPKLYGTVYIPPEVEKELSTSKRETEARTFIATSPPWLKVQMPKIIEYIPRLDPGERAAISLARELNADVLLMDETMGRREAMARKIPTVRTAAVIFEAANKKLIPDLADAFDRLLKTDFRVPRKALDELLKLHNELRKRE